MIEPWQELLERLDLADIESEILRTIVKDKRKQEWLACRALLKEMLGTYVLIGYDAQRKPYLTGIDTQISMSHSGDYVTVYLSDNSTVGVDIQEMKPSISKGAFYFLNDMEMQWANLEDNLQMHLIWSAKEAVFKYAGDAAIDMKKHMTISPFTSNQTGSFEVTMQKGIDQQIVQLQFDTFENYVLTWTI